MIFRRKHRKDKLMPERHGKRTEKTNELSALEDVSKYFDIDLTETEESFLAGVKRRSDGKDMLFSMALCEFPHYMEWWYGAEVGPSEDDPKKYRLKKDTFQKSAPDEKDPCTDDVRFWIEMFIFEHRYAFGITEDSASEKSNGGKH